MRLTDVCMGKKRIGPAFNYARGLGVMVGAARARKLFSECAHSLGFAGTSKQGGAR